MKMKIFYLAAVVAAMVSCKKESANTQTGRGAKSVRNNYTPYGCPLTTVPFIAGQHIDAGTIEVTNDADYIYVTYNTANGYVLKETHLYVGNCEAIPVNKKGNPVPGLFPNKNTHNNATSYTYRVPVSAIGLYNCGCIAAHAAVVKLDYYGSVIDSQTGWGAGTAIAPANGNWGTKFEYCPRPCAQ